MNVIIYVLSISLLFAATFCVQNSFSQNRTTTIFDVGAPISQIAYNLSQYHLKLAQEELAKVPPNDTGAYIHANLGGMTAAEITDMIEGATLSEENKQKLLAADPGGCIIISDGTVKCLN
jgi:hypothetical protein